MIIQSWKCGVTRRKLGKRNKRWLSYFFKLECQPRSEKVRVDVYPEKEI